jgi:hypothetical protein
MIKPSKIQSKAQLTAVVKKKKTSKAEKYIAYGDVLSPNGGGVMYDENIPNRTIKSKLNSIIGKK